VSFDPICVIRVEHVSFFFWKFMARLSSKLITSWLYLPQILERYTMTMRFFDEIWPLLNEGTVHDVRIGLNWTAVVVETQDHKRCGLASTLKGSHEHTGEPTIPRAGKLIGSSAMDLARLAQGQDPTRTSLGVAAINAMLPQYPETWTDRNVEEVLSDLGKDKPVALIGHFPFVSRLRQVVCRLDVIDRNPLPGDYPESAAAEILPQAGVVAITGMTLLNGTLPYLLDLCTPKATVLLMGPSTPLSPLMFEYGINILGGSIVTDIEAVLLAVSQGANFRQVKSAGVRLVTMEIS
jgi:uncharacterized protein (DUF4213/DUF364 family)